MSAAQGNYVSDDNWESPFLLIAVEAWFLAGGILCIWLGHSMRGRGR